MNKIRHRLSCSGGGEIQCKGDTKRVDHDHPLDDRG